MIANSSQANGTCHRVCLTPTRNEAWIIKKFLAAAQYWATRIVVADQGSTDGTRDILRATPGTEIILNDSPEYNEGERTELLLSKARQIEGHRILVALDADEALSSNCATSAEWKRLSQAKPGTVLRFKWVNILPGFNQAWIPPNRIACGFVDDGSPNRGTRIHSPRVPYPPGAPAIDVEEVVVLHFQYVVWERMVSKHRWYQAWELLNHPDKKALQIFRQYHHMDGSWDPSEIQPVKPEWFEGYERAGVDFRSLSCEAITWWDRELVQLLQKHGPEHFRKLSIWDRDWNAIASLAGLKGADLQDPRSAFEKSVHCLLKASQKRRGNLATRAFERFLRGSGW